MFNTNIRIACSVNCIYALWHALNYVSHAARGIWSTILNRCFLKYECGSSSLIPVSDCDYRTSPLFDDTCDHNKLQLPR